jgi:hypothetical protein
MAHTARLPTEPLDAETSEWLCRQNIKAFRERLAAEKAESQRVLLTTLLDWEMEKLNALRHSAEVSPAPPGPRQGRPRRASSRKASPAAASFPQPEQAPATPPAPGRSFDPAGRLVGGDFGAIAEQGLTSATALRRTLEQSVDLVREARLLLGVKETSSLEVTFRADTPSAAPTVATVRI